MEVESFFPSSDQLRLWWFCSGKSDKHGDAGECQEERGAWREQGRWGLPGYTGLVAADLALSEDAVVAEVPREQLCVKESCPLPRFFTQHISLCP